MKSNNPHYHDISIDYNVLQNLPSDGSIFEELKSYNIEDDEIDDDDCGEEVGAPQVNATGPLPDEEGMNVTESHACVNPLIQNESENHEKLPCT